MHVDEKLGKSLAKQKTGNECKIPKPFDNKSKLFKIIVKF